MTNFRICCKVDSITYFMIDSKTNKHHQVINPLKLIEFETYCVEPNPPLFFRQQDMQWSRNNVHSHLHTMLEGP